MQEFLTGGAAPSRHVSNPSLQELLAFERLLSDVSARFANVAGDRVVEELEGALKRLLEFLGFDRCAFWEFVGEEQYFLCSVAVEGVEPPARGPVPAQLSWFARELRAGRTIVVQSGDAPPEAAAAVEYNRRAGIRSVLVIPLIVGGRVVAAIGFGAFRSTREWPAEFVARVTVIGEVMAQSLARARSEAALRASEQRWQSIFETSSIGISTIDKDLRYLSTNPSFRAMLGYSDEEFRHLTPLDITFEEEREISQLRLAELQQGKVDHYAVVKRYRRKDGSVIWGHSSIARAMKYKPEMFIGAMIDITDSKLAEEKLRATEKELTRVTRLTAAGQMAASIAHEIKQPLAAIVAGASAGLRWLSRPKPDLVEVRAGLEAIVSDGNRASDVIDGIRAIFKNDSRERISLDVNEVIREVLALMQFELHNHRILVSTELTSGLQPVVADRIQLQQVIANLIANAIEAMQFTEGRARSLRVRSATDTANDVLVMVEDSGPGIDPENLDRIFHPFFTTKPQGTGMGLSISRSIIEAHNGHLTVSPAADGGSVFQIALPTADLSSCGESGG